MRSTCFAAFVAVLLSVSAVPARAQRVPFDRTFDVGAAAVLDVSTDRGKIDVVAGDPDRIVVRGVVTVRVGIDVPANALEVAQKLAATPPVSKDGQTVRLRPPTEAADRRAVTISYQVQVPPEAEVRTESDSGATSVSAIRGHVTVHTQSAAITLASLGGAVDVTTGSGAVTVDGSAGLLTVKTSSSGFTGTKLAGLQLRTTSGAVNAGFSGDGDVTVETGSGAIKLTGLRGALAIATQSGRIQAAGASGKPWTARTGSSSIELTVPSDAAFSIDASSRSGNVIVEGASVDGTVARHKVAGSVRGGGALIQATTESGAIRVRVGAR